MTQPDERSPDDWRVVRRVATDEEARALASALRMRILRVCLHEPHTNKEIAGILDRDPATTLHHVRRLVDTGFLTAEPVRRGTRGSREIPYRATGKSWGLQGVPAKDRVLLDAFLEEVVLVPVHSVQTARLGLRMDDELKSEFDDRLMELFEEFRGRADAANAGDAWSIFYSIHPDPNFPTTRRASGGDGRDGRDNDEAVDRPDHNPGLDELPRPEPRRRQQRDPRGLAP